MITSIIAFSQAMQGNDNVFIGTIKLDGTVLDEANAVIGKFKADGMVTVRTRSLLVM